MDYKWITFTDMSGYDAKTKRFMISNKENQSALGEVKWYGAWRKYCFFPASNCIFETQCLSDIISFLNKLQTEWKVKQQEKQQNKF